MFSIQPINFNGEDNVAMQNLLASIRRQDELEEAARRERIKAAQDEMKQKRELTKLIDASVLSKNLEVEVADAGIGNLRNTVAGYMKQNPNVSSVELETFISKQLSDISQWNNKVKLIKTRLDDQFKNLPQDDRITKSSWMNAALTEALYKNVPVIDPATGVPAVDANGQPQMRRTLKSLQDLDDQADFGTKVWNRDGHNFVNLEATDEKLKEKLSKQPKVTVDVATSVGASKGKAGFSQQKTIEIPTFTTWDPKLEKPVVKSLNGKIDPDIYTGFVGTPGSVNDKFVAMRAKQRVEEADPEFLNYLGLTDIYASNGKDIDPTKLATAQVQARSMDLEDLKKAWLEQYIEKNTGYTTREREATKPAITNVTVSTGEKNTAAGLNWMKKVDAAIAAGDRAQIINLMGVLKSGSGSATKLRGPVMYSGDEIVLNLEGGPDNRDYIVSGTNRDGSPRWMPNPNKGKPSTEQIRINFKSADASQDFARVYQQMMGQNSAIETYQLGKLP